MQGDGKVERYTADTTTAVSATVVCVYDSNLAHTEQMPGEAYLHTIGAHLQ